MVIFHFSFDLNHFHIVDLDLKHDAFWKYFRILIVSIFVFLAGVSLQLTHKDMINVKKIKKRILLLGGASLLVSIASYTQFPHTWIYFGILHFFLFASVVGLLFLRIPRIAFMMGIFIVVASYLSWINVHWLYDILKYPLHLPLYYTEDLAKIFPWFGVFLLGMSSVYFEIHRLLFEQNIFTKKSYINHFFSFLGRHSLFIYMLHQPLLFFLFSLLNY